METITNGVSNCTESHSMSDREFFQKMYELIFKEAIEKTTAGKCKVSNFLHPEDLKEKLDLAIQDEAMPAEAILKLCQQTFDYSVKPGHPRFFNQLFAGQDLYGLAGQWMSDAINPSQYTYEVSPVFTLMELEVMKKLRELCGYKSGDGIFCPGGSIANMYAMNLARYKQCPQIKQQGLYGQSRLVLFTSEQSHYSIKKGAAFLGLGTDNIVFVKCDEIGRMMPEHLEKAITETKQNGGEPFFVVATSGTTVLGAYDPLDPIADICEAHGIWLHVDAAWGGSVLFSSKYRHLMKGVERTKSVTWCQHKMMGVPLQCSAFLVRDEVSTAWQWCRSQDLGPISWLCLEISALTTSVFQGLAGNFLLVRVCTPRYWAFSAYTATADIRHLPNQQRMVIASAESDSKQSHEIGTWSQSIGLPGPDCDTAA